VVGVREATRRCDVQYSSLRDRIRDRECFHPKLGRKTTINEEQQCEIAKHCLHLANLFFGFVAFEYAELNKIKNTFNKTQRLAGKD
jgi:hypothetical protein